LAHNQLTDLVIVFIHLGTEYENEPNSSQKKIAQFLFQQHFDIIIGSNPHVIQVKICKFEILLFSI